MNTITQAFLKQKIHECVRPSEEVQLAVEEGQPLVVIDYSNVLTRVPFDRAMEALHQASESVRSRRAIPVFSGVVQGQIRVGLTISELSDLAGKADTTVASRHRLPALIAAGGNAVADVSLAMVIAELAGIRVLATTTIDGVTQNQLLRRSPGQSRARSSLAYELSRTTVAVVCSGPSAVDDARESLNLFLSYGVPVIGYGEGVLPQHFVRDTGIRLEQELGNPKDIAETMHYLWRLGLSGGMLILCPINSKFSIPNQDLYAWLTSEARDFEEADQKAHKELTRFIASQWADLILKSDGRTVAAECTLIRDNALVAANTARAFTE